MSPEGPGRADPGEAEGAGEGEVPDSAEATTPVPAPTPAPRRKRTPSKRKPAAAVDVPVLISKIDDSGNPVETREEQTARLDREASESRHKAYLDWLAHGVFAFLLVAVTLTFLYIVARGDSQTSPDTTRLAGTLLTAIVSAGASFFAGKAAGKAT